MNIYELLEQEKEIAESKAVLISGKPKLIDLFRDRYDFFVYTLFPVWKSDKLKVYEKLAEILKQGGYETVTDSSVAVMLNRVKSERNKKGVKSTPSPKSVTSPVAVSVTSPVSIEKKDYADFNPEWNSLEKEVKAVKVLTDWTPSMEEHWNYTQWISKTNYFPDSMKDTWVMNTSEQVWDCRFLMQQRRKLVGLPI